MFVLKRGATGQEVKRLQKHLLVQVDGAFGPKTEEALKKYQRSNGLAADGIYGLATQTKMGTEIWEGLDVSHHNGVVDWKAVSKTGNKFAIIKTSEGRGFEDPRAVFNFSEAKKNKLLVGAYHFGRPDTDEGPTDAVIEADFFIKQLKKLDWQNGLDILPILDLEAGMKTDDEYNAAWCKSFCEEIKNKLGCNTIVYTARWYWDGYLVNASKKTLDSICEYPVWWADYTTNTQEDPDLRGWDSWEMWQWTGFGSIDGVKGKVDRNWLPGGQQGLNKLTRG
jgi:lysozyme